MICAFCNTEYTVDQPCFCYRAPSATSSQKESKSLAPLPEERQVPTGLDNPFWN